MTLGHAQDLALIVEAAREAGELAMALRERGLITEFKPGDSPVTTPTSPPTTS
jgi:hypothetical protein